MNKPATKPAASPHGLWYRVEYFDPAAKRWKTYRDNLLSLRDADNQRQLLFQRRPDFYSRILRLEIAVQATPIHTDAFDKVNAFLEGIQPDAGTLREAEKQRKKS